MLSYPKWKKAIYKEKKSVGDLNNQIIFFAESLNNHFYAPKFISDLERNKSVQSSIREGCQS